MRCLSTKGTCGGYVVKPRKNQSWKNRLAAVKTLSPVSDPSIHQGFDDDLQQQYFDEWRYLSRESLGGHVPSKLWSTFMPQLSYQNMSLRFAALAIGALSLSMPPGSSLEASSQGRHYHNAIAYYCRALRLLGQASAEATNLQDTLLASVLFASFEGLRGNKTSELQHISSGFVLLRDTLATPGAQNRIERVAAAPGELIKEVFNLYAQLAIQTQTVKKGALEDCQIALRSPSPTSEMTFTLDAVNCRLTEYLCPRAGLEQIPTAFTSPDEAWEHLRAAERWIETAAHDVASTMGDILYKMPNDPTGLTEILLQLQSHPFLNKVYQDADEMLQRWMRAFEPLYQKVLISYEKSCYQVYMTVRLRVDYLSLSMYLQFHQRGDYYIVSSMTNTCRELNELCETLLREQVRIFRGPASEFTIHTGLAWPLVFVAMNCRDSIVRDNAIRILESYPRRDGLWDSLSFADVARRNRQLEMDNASGGGSIVEQWHRLCRRVFLFEEAGARVVFRFLAKDALTGQWELAEEFAECSQSKPLLWKRRPVTDRRYILQWGRTSDSSPEALLPGMGCGAPKLDI